MIRVPSWGRKAAELFGIQFCWYFITTLNFRAVAEVRFIDTFVTDILISTLAFVSIKRVVNATTLSERLAYMFGGACGALLALWLSTFWFDK